MPKFVANIITLLKKKKKKKSMFEIRDYLHYFDYLKGFGKSLFYYLYVFFFSLFVLAQLWFALKKIGIDKSR